MKSGSKLANGVVARPGGERDTYDNLFSLSSFDLYLAPLFNELLLRSSFPPGFLRY